MSYKADPIVPDHLRPGARLRHYKGGLYRVEGSCIIEATLEVGILYRSIREGDTEAMWVRAVQKFDELVSTPDGRVPRFSAV